MPDTRGLRRRPCERHRAAGSPGHTSGRAPLAGCLAGCQTSHMAEGIIDALAIARAEFERRLTAITDDDWGRPTPCTQWNVRQLVNHIVSHEYRYADNLAANNSEYYVASRDDDFLGGDPHGSWPRGVALLDEAIAGLDSLDTTISFLLPLPARDVLLVRVFEAAVHTWDVSRAIGFDERIDERLATLTCPLLERLIQVPAIA
ncbi:MAG: TIGR03086 family metal-binding protein [Micromonosporaceae bacterium]